MELFTTILNHSFNLIFLVGFIFKKVLRLRIMMIIAALIETVYYMLPRNFDWVNIGYGVAIIIINSVQIFLLFRSKSSIKLTEDESRIYKIAFTPLNQKNFKKLISVAKWETAQTGTVLINEGTRLDKLMLIFTGVAEVRTDGQTLAYLRDGNFIGEMSFISGNKTSANVTALSEIKYLTWDKQVLSSIATESKELEEELNAVFKMDLVKKLVNKGE